MKIKSFMGRRLLLGLTADEVSNELSNSLGHFIDIRRIEKLELEIQALNNLYDKLEQEQDSEK